MERNSNSLMKTGYGNIPDASILLDDDNYKKNLVNLLNWCSSSLSYDELKDETLLYFVNEHNYDELKNKQPELFYIVGKLCWISNNGGILSTESTAYLNNEITKIVENGEEISQKQDKSTIKLLKRDSIAEKRNQKLSDVFAHIQDFVDEYTLNQKPYSEELYEMLSEYNLERGDLSVISYKVRQSINELSNELRDIQTVNLEFFDGEDGYNEYKNNLTMQLMVYNDSLEIIKSITGNITNMKSSSVKLSPKQKKSIKNTNFKMADNDLKVIGIQPANIINKNTVYVYNTSKKKLARYVGLEGGITIDGSTLKNIDMEKSIQKHLRNPQKMLSEIQNADAHRANILFSEMFGEKFTKATPRLTDKSLIIKSY